MGVILAKSSNNCLSLVSKFRNDQQFFEIFLKTIPWPNKHFILIFSFFYLSEANATPSPKIRFGRRGSSTFGKFFFLAIFDINSVMIKAWQHVIKNLCNLSYVYVPNNSCLVRRLSMNDHFDSLTNFFSLHIFLFF